MARPFGPILLLDDDPDALFYTKAAIANARVSNPVVAFGSAEELMSYLERASRTGMTADQTPALLLLDLRMPRVGGFEVLRTIREQPAYNSMKTFMLTAYNRDADRSRAEELGANGYLVKPLSAQQISDILDTP